MSGEAIFCLILLIILIAVVVIYASINHYIDNKDEEKFRKLVEDGCQGHQFNEKGLNSLNFDQDRINYLLHQLYYDNKIFREYQTRKFNKYLETEGITDYNSLPDYLVITWINVQIGEYFTELGVENFNFYKQEWKTLVCKVDDHFYRPFKENNFHKVEEKLLRIGYMPVRTRKTGIKNEEYIYFR